MPKMNDVVSGEVIDSVWGNDIRDRSLQRVATETDRDSSYLSPNPGDVVFVEAIDEVQYWDGAVWRTVYTADGDIEIDGTVIATGFRNPANTAGIYEDGSSNFLDVNTDEASVQQVLRVDPSNLVSGQTLFCTVPDGSNYVTHEDSGLTRFRTWNGTGYFTQFELSGGTIKNEVTALFYNGSVVDTYDETPIGGGDKYSYQVRNVIIAENVPSSASGKDGDICMQYQTAGSAQNAGCNVWVKVEGAWRGMS